MVEIGENSWDSECRPCQHEMPLNWVFAIQWEGPDSTIYNIISKRTKYGGIYKKTEQKHAPRKMGKRENIGCSHVCGVKRICVSLGKVDAIHVRKNSLVIEMWKINDRGKEEIYEGPYWNR